MQVQVQVQVQVQHLEHGPDELVVGGGGEGGDGGQDVGGGGEERGRVLVHQVEREARGEGAEVVQEGRGRAQLGGRVRGQVLEAD